jgi:arginase
MSRPIHLLGVPSNAGAHWPGQEKAPAAIRHAGLVEILQAAGCEIVDHGDLPERRWQIARESVGDHHVNNLDATIAVAEQVASQVRDALEAGGFPVAIGGDCTITVGAFAGALHAHSDLALVYVDGGWDLSTPAIYPKGILDSMGAAHLLGLDGTTRLRDIGPRVPMLTKDKYVQFGYAPEDPPGLEWEVVEALSLNGVSANAVRGRAVESARETLASYIDGDQPYWLHFDVDVIDFFDVPVADVPIYGDALPFEDAISAVSVFACDPRCIGMTVTEFNPDHGHPDGREATLLAISLGELLTLVV